MLIRDFLQNVSESLKYKGNLWLALVGIPVLVIAATIILLANAPAQMNLPVLGMIGIAVMLLVFCTGMPIAFSLMAVGLVFLVYMRGPWPPSTYWEILVLHRRRLQLVAPHVLFTDGIFVFLLRVW